MTETAGVEASLRQSRENTVLAHLEAENRQDIPATLATFKPGAARTELPGEVAVGHDAVAATYLELFTALPDMHFDIKDDSLCHHGDRVICETRVHGTHQGPFRGIPPTGRRIDLPIVAIFQFDGPDLICDRAYFDRITMFMQLGLAHDPNTLAGRVTTLLNHPLTIARAALHSRRADKS
jgi:steroid delta-isomerase-like uncharacterized protein